MQTNPFTYILDKLHTKLTIIPFPLSRILKNSQDELHKILKQIKGSYVDKTATS